MNFNSGIDIEPVLNPLGFNYGDDCFGPEVEKRTLKDIRKSLLDPDCEGPETVYAIAMDVGKQKHKNLLEEKMLLYGVVTYAAGRLGDEPIRSQGHIHRKSIHSGWSPPEIYEIWVGNAIIYMQEYAENNPGRCYAVHAEAGNVVIVPPGWAHATISANPDIPLTFGAWCDREYGFVYDKVRAHQGLAWYPLLDGNNNILWKVNSNYHFSQLIEKTPDDYLALDIEKGLSIYSQFEQDAERFQYVSKPYLKTEIWKNFEP